MDADVNALLGLDARREAAVAVVSLGAGQAAPGAPEVAPLTLATEPLSRAEIEYPLIWQTHAATGLRDCDDVTAWRQQALARPTPPPPLHTPESGVLGLEASIENRGSARRFSPDAFGLDALEAVLSVAKGSRHSDHAIARELIRPLLIANRVEGVESGAYSVGASGELSPMKTGDFSAVATHLALDQAAGGSAAVNLYFVASMAKVVTALGERGYRAVQMEAGIRTGQVYLAATALGLKATGLTFYDDEAAGFFDLDAGDTLVMMLVAFGP